ncbi:uncharacterized protein LY89DRAFT_594589, partial [Mollisia scopiformis]
QLLACMNWMGEFQILACIPLQGSIATKEVADLAGVPEKLLYRVVRMMATAGFLQEPQPGHIAHTALSTPLVTDLSCLDAAIFLAQIAAPTALHMASATQRPGDPEPVNKSAYSIAFNTSQTFELTCVERTKLQRQWFAYRRCAAGDVEGSMTELLGRLNWHSLGGAYIVDVRLVCAQSTEAAIVLAEMYPSLRFIVQMMDEPARESNGPAGPGKVESSGGRITVQKRMPGAVQGVMNAAVYILRLPTAQQMLVELNAHLGVLRANTSATLILGPPLLPEPGAVDRDVEVIARQRDLYRLQLTNQYGMELGELVEIVNGVGDSEGHLIVASRLRSPTSTAVALGVKYEAYVGGTHAADEVI